MKKVASWLVASFAVVALAGCGAKTESTTYSGTLGGLYDTEAKLSYSDDEMKKMDLTMTMDLESMGLTKEDLEDEDMQSQLDDMVSGAEEEFGGDGVTAKAEIKDTSMVITLNYDFEKIDEDSLSTMFSGTEVKDGKVSYKEMAKALEDQGMTKE